MQAVLPKPEMDIIHTHMFRKENFDHSERGGNVNAFVPLHRGKVEYPRNSLSGPTRLTIWLPQFGQVITGGGENQGKLS
jgi:hypothetical protein